MGRNSMESWAIQAWDEFKKTNDEETVSTLLSFNISDAVELFDDETNKQIALIQIESITILQFGYTLTDGQNDQTILKNVMALQAFINMKEEQRDFDVDQFKKDLEEAGNAALKGEIIDLNNELDDEETLDDLIDQIVKLI